MGFRVKNFIDWSVFDNRSNDTKGKTPLLNENTHNAGNERYALDTERGASSVRVLASLFLMQQGTPHRSQTQPREGGTEDFWGVSQRRDSEFQAVECGYVSFIVD